jgi:putative Mg2+ transporter-C (MgtC) family protein
MILRDAGRVRGLTTAAGVWAVAAIGIMIGAGEYIMGVSLTVLIVLVLAKERIPLVRRIGHTTARERRPDASAKNKAES